MERVDEVPVWSDREDIPDDFQAFLQDFGIGGSASIGRTADLCLTSQLTQTD
jgi:hypothetical protein